MMRDAQRLLEHYQAAVATGLVMLKEGCEGSQLSPAILVCLAQKALKLTVRQRLNLL